MNTTDLQPISVATAPQTISQTIKWISRLGLSVMPECPIEAEKAWGAKSAKRPCFWNHKRQEVTAVSWKLYQDTRPTQADKAYWFASEKTQVGCLGGWNGKHWLAWIDFDLHHFPSPEALDTQLAEWEEKYPLLGQAPKFKSPSGGYRYLVAFAQKPDKFGGNSGFTLVAGDSSRLGEILTNNGGHTLIPPTASYNGNYVWERWSEYPPIVNTPEEIGLFPVTKKSKQKAPQPPKQTPQPRRYAPGSIRLEDLLCPSAKHILTSSARKGTRSDAIATLANEAFGWMNWLEANGVSFSGSPHELIEYAWNRMEEKDSDPNKWLRAIDKIEGDTNVTPAAEYQGGDEACWKKIRSLDKGSFEAKCPDYIKTSLKGMSTQIQARQSNSKGNKPDKPSKVSYPSGNKSGSDDSNGSGNGNSNFEGSGGFGDDTPNHWNAPSSWKGEIGWWESRKGENDNGEPTEELTFSPKCNFDFQIEQELSSVDGEDGGGIVLQVKRSIDSEQKQVIIKSVDYGSAKDFELALKKALGDGIVVNLKSDQLKSLIHVRLREYRKRGGKKYKLIDRFGQQEDGTWVFANKQFSQDGTPINLEESEWVFTSEIAKEDKFESPEILEENPAALKNLIEAQKKVAGSNFIRWLLCNGHVAACLNERAIVAAEGFMPILNLTGDAGGGKTMAAKAALSPVWGNSDKGVMCSFSESYLYEWLRRYGSIPSLLDDPPSKRREDKEKLDELIKRIYNKFARKVRGNDQKPHSSPIPTSNHQCGDTLAAAKTRTINLFFPVIKDMNMDCMPELEEAKRQATGAFRSIISLGYNQAEIRQLSKRLLKHLPTAHDRAAPHLAILTWYTQKIIELAGLEIDIEAWVIKNLCPDMNEAQTGLDSISDFFERFLAARSLGTIGSWNCNLVQTAEYGRCLAIQMSSIWTEIEKSGDQPSYNRSVLERVLVQKGAVKNKTAKLDRDKDSALAYQREVHKGRNEGDGWVAPSKPKPVNKKCILIPEKLWGDFEILPLINPEAPPGGGDNLEDDEGLVTSGNLQAPESNQELVTDLSPDISRGSTVSPPPGNLVTKKYTPEEKKEKEKTTQDETQDRLWNQKSADSEEKNVKPLQNLVTGLPATPAKAELVENTEVEQVTKKGYLEVTDPEKEVTWANKPLDMAEIMEAVNQQHKDPDESDLTAPYYEEEPIDQSEDKIKKVVEFLQGFYKEKVDTSEMISEASKAHKCTHDEAKEVERRFEEWKRGQPQFEAESSPLDRGEIVAALREVKKKEAKEQSAAQGEPVEEIQEIQIEKPLDMAENIAAVSEPESQPKEEEAPAPAHGRNQISSNSQATYRVWSKVLGFFKLCTLYTQNQEKQFFNFRDLDNDLDLIPVMLKAGDWFEVNPG